MSTTVRHLAGPDCRVGGPQLFHAEERVSFLCNAGQTIALPAALRGRCGSTLKGFASAVPDRHGLPFGGHAPRRQQHSGGYGQVPHEKFLGSSMASSQGSHRELTSTGAGRGEGASM